MVGQAKKPPRGGYQTVQLEPTEEEVQDDAEIGSDVAIGVGGPADLVKSTEIGVIGDDDPDDSRAACALELGMIVHFGWANSVNQVLQFVGGFVMMMFFQSADEIGGGGMGFMFGNVTGISLIVGFGTGMTPLAAQAFGAGNFKRVGDLLQRQLLMHVVLVCVPVAFIWHYAGAVLVAFGQPAGISALTQDFLRWRIAALPFYALQLDLESMLQCTQAPVMPRTILYATSAAFNVLLFWLFIEGRDAGGWLGMGFVGAPFAMTVTNILTSLVLLWLTPRLVLKEVWPKWNFKTAFAGWGELAKLSAPGALMLWAEWWGGELNLFLAGLLCTKGLYPPPSLLGSFNSSGSPVSGGYVGSTAEGAGDSASCVPLDVFPLLTQTLTVAFMSHLGFSLQGAAHIGNLLGANKPHRARRASKVLLFFVVSIGLGWAFMMLTFRQSWGEMFTDEQDILDMITSLLPYVSLYVVGDAFGASGLASILRGAGLVHGPAAINILSFYAIGIPFGLWLTFGSPAWHVFGLWSGLSTAVWTMVIGLLVYLFCGVDFEAVALEASTRATADMDLERRAIADAKLKAAATISKQTAATR